MGNGVGRLARRLSLASLVAAVLAVGAPTGAGAATTVGDTFPPPENGAWCGSNFTRLQSVSPGDQYEIPFDGVITSWSFEGNATTDAPIPQLKFKVGRPSGNGAFTIVGESALETPTQGLNTFPAQIPVQAGDVLGNYTATSGECSVALPGFDVAYEEADVPPGGTVNEQELDSKLDIAAQLETKKCKGKAPTMAGTTGKDTLLGTPGKDVIVGLEGKDTIKGFGGKDRLCGHKGKDTLKGGGANDFLKGAKGRDRLKGGSGEDTCVGGKSEDTAAKCEVEKSI